MRLLFRGDLLVNPGTANKRWKVSPVDKELQMALARGLGILPLTAQLLINRGLVDTDKASLFLRPELKDLHDPFLLKGMEKGVSRIASAIKAGERICVYGDYDVDGATSAALVYLFLRELGCEPGVYIPERAAEGYGLNSGAIKKLHSDGFKIIITVDCGSSNAEEARLAASLGIDLIITDHHEVPDEAPLAFSIINPKQSGCAFPFKGLAGVGVAFNLIMALRAKLREEGFFKGDEPNLKKYLDLVSVGTVADMVPLVDENRIFVSCGLKELEQGKRPGLKALRDISCIKPNRIDADTIAFQLAPRINAAGRLERADAAFRLLVTQDPDEARRLAEGLEQENSRRQRLEGDIFTEAFEMASSMASGNKGLVLWSDNWHPGVIGIVASRLVEKFSVPVVMIAVDKDVGKGSARGIRSFNMLDGLKGCSALLEKFGGHKAAAGLTISRENLQRFSEEFLGYLNRTIRDEDLVPEVNVDAVVSLNDIDNRFVSEVEALSPFGSGNHEPVLCVPSAQITHTEVVGNRHLRFRVAQNGCALRGIGFGLAGLHPIKGDGFGIAFSPYMDEWQGVRNLRLRIRDIQRAFEGA